MFGLTKTAHVTHQQETIDSLVARNAELQEMIATLQEEWAKVKPAEVYTRLRDIEKRQDELLLRLKRLTPISMDAIEAIVQKTCIIVEGQAKWIGRLEDRINDALGGAEDQE